MVTFLPSATVATGLKPKRIPITVAAATITAKRIESNVPFLITFARNLLIVVILPYKAEIFILVVACGQ